MILKVDAQIAVEAMLSPAWGATAVPPGWRDDHEEKVVDWLGRLRLLQGVPFEYLVPDAGLLEPETIRFFHLDRNWTDAAVDGAIAAGTVTSRDRREVQADHEDLRGLVDDAERAQWVDPPVSSALPAPATGFLLRSRAVSGWPGLHVRAFRTVNRRRETLRVLRLERLAPAVLVALFDGVPERVEIEEPRTGIQFGVRSNRFAGEPDGSWWLDVRDPATGDELMPLQTERVPFRAGSAGVIHLTELRRRLLEGRTAMFGGDIESDDLALQLLRFPYQQAFEGEGRPGPPGMVKVPGRVLDAAVVNGPWLIADGSRLIERIGEIQ